MQTFEQGTITLQKHSERWFETLGMQFKYKLKTHSKIKRIACIVHMFWGSENECTLQHFQCKMENQFVSIGMMRVYQFIAACFGCLHVVHCSNIENTFR